MRRAEATAAGASKAGTRSAKSSVTIASIDATGAGRFSSFVESRNPSDEDIRRATVEATRTVGDGIGWSGTYVWSVSSAGLSEEFTFSTDTNAVGERISRTGT